MHLSISVVIPTYNSEKTILRTIHSVKIQTYTPKEIIVVDDGSKDRTCELIKTQFPEIILIRQQNAGAAAARNTGIRKATGDLIAFLDSDDFWHQQKLEYQATAFEQIPSLGICSTKCIFLYESNDLNPEKESTKPINSYSHKKIEFNQLFRFPFLGTPSVVIKRTLVEAIGGFDESLETAEDVDVWIKAAFLAEYRLIPIPLTYVVLQEQSLSIRARTSPYEAHLKVIDNFVKGKKLSIFFKIIILRKVKAHAYCNWGSNLLIAQSFSTAKQKLLKSLINFPNLRATYLLLKILFK